MCSTIQFKILDHRLHDFPPTFATSGSAAVDLRACLVASLTVLPNETHLIPTGFAIYIADPSIAGIVVPRSGLGFRHGIVLGNLVGLIDSDYQGEIKVPIWNRSETPYTIEPMTRMAQLFFVPILRPNFTLVEEFEATERATGGFGSTGIH